METFKPEQPKEQNRYTHLKEGIKPIMACIGTQEQFEEEPKKNPKAHIINFFNDSHELNKKDFKNDGARTYVISTLDDLDKASRSFFNCLGLVAAGVERKTGENVSFLSHQRPWQILKGNHEKFVKDFDEKLAELKERGEKGTIDVVIFGGNYLVGGQGSQFDYRSSVELLSTEVEKILGFKPVVIAGPKLTEGGENVLYDNEYRRLYILRPEVGNSSSESFSPDKIKEQEEKWQKEGKNIFFPDKNRS